MNIWTVLWAMTYIVPMFWLMMDFKIVIKQMMDTFGISYRLARLVAVLAVLLWPVAMVAEMMTSGDDE
jgi:hypothetical protein